jgi:hypothetical protein
MADELVHRAVVVDVPRRELSIAEKQIARLKGLEDTLLRDSLEVVTGVCEFAGLDPGTSEPPPEWIEDLGEAGAWKKFRLVMAGWMNSKDAPIGIAVATKMSVGIIRARASSKAAPINLNVGKIEMSYAPIQYPTIDE